MNHLIDFASTEERYRALLRAAQNLFAITNLDELIENVLKHAGTMMQCEACSIFLPDHAAKELILYSARGKDDAFHTIRIPWDRGIAGTCYHQREFIRIDDAENDPRIFRNLKPGANDFVTRGMLCAPLSDREDCFGVIQALNPVDRPVFTQLDQDIFEGLTNIVTGALVRFDREKKIQQKEKMDRELNLALEIQKSYLPPESTYLPLAEVLTHYRPARTIGGDFYTILLLSDDRILVAIGDVSGKGVPAALTTAMIISEMNALSFTLEGEEGGLSNYVCALNDSLCRRLAAGRFAATTFLLYSPQINTMEVICAGQFEPWRLTSADKWEQVSVSNDLPLGIAINHPFVASAFVSAPGEKWLIFSDGINEGRNRESIEFGFDRLMASLTSGTNAPHTIVDRAWQSWCDFVDLDNQHDDACLTLVLTKPPAELILTSEVSCCKPARTFVESWALFAGYTDLDRGAIVLACDEALTNIIRHTYNQQPGQEIQLSATVTETEFHLYMRDFGPPVDREKLRGRDLDDIKPGGLGLHLLTLVFPTMEHEDLADGNRWHMAKPLPGFEAAPLTEQPAI